MIQGALVVVDQGMGRIVTISTRAGMDGGAARPPTYREAPSSPEKAVPP